MEKQAFKFLQSIESSWWYKGRVAAVSRALACVRGTAHTILDAGAGYGAMYSLLSAYGSLLDAFEPDLSARETLTRRGYRRVVSSINEVAGVYDMVGAFDVIEHVEDDQLFVEQLYQHTSEGGILVATVPAFMMLWSEHDVLHQHFRRYTKAEFVRLFERAGYTVRYVRYWNVSLFPVVFLMRLVGRGGGESLSPHPVVNTLLTWVLKLEAAIFSRIPIPFGVSLVVVVQKS